MLPSIFYSTSLPSMREAFSLLSTLVDIGERQIGGETRAAEHILMFLQEHGMACSQQDVPVRVPVQRRADLRVDGQVVPCRATSFVSGSIVGKDNILSSALPMAESPDLPNINVNPYCSGISRGNHYWQPAIAVSHSGLAHVLQGNDVRADVEVELVSHTARNILVGNAVDPRSVIFTHYDSVGPGANDNASGVVATVLALLAQPAILEHSLIVFSGAEELSTDKPLYWGAGYRQFQSDYAATLDQAEHILVVDSVGAGDITVIQNARTVRRAFPLTDMEVLLPKIQLITGDLSQLMRVYHSEDDQEELVDQAMVMAAAQRVVKMSMHE